MRRSVSARGRRSVGAPKFRVLAADGEGMEPTPTTRPLLARQAIVDDRTRTVGYELLYRGDRLPDGRPVDEPRATTEVVWNAWMELGRTALAGTLPLWVNVTRENLLDPGLLDMPAEGVVLEVLEDVRIDGELRLALAGLRRRGFELALDDFVPGGPAEALLDLVRIVKLDVRARGAEQVAADARELRARGIQVVAEKVETHEEVDALRAAGVRWFQGYAFERPVVVEGRVVPMRAVEQVRRCVQVAGLGDDLDAIADVVRDDPVLVFRFIRLANAAHRATVRPVESLHDALVRLGAREARRWLTLLALHGVADPSHPALATGMQRAHLCEELARDEDRDVRDRAYLVGLLSVLDALMGPLETVLAEVDLAPAIVDALLEHRGVEGRLLEDAIAVQRGFVPVHVGEALAAQSALQATRAADAALQATAPAA